MVALASIASMQPNNSHTWFSNLLRIGSVRIAEPKECQDFVTMNYKQRKSALWLQENHIPVYCNLHPETDAKMLRSAVVYSRLGVLPEQSMLVITLSLFKIEGILAKPIETRYITLGISGGRTLLNPKRFMRVGGDNVLKVSVI